MIMYYKSTRNEKIKERSTAAILQGISKEGGLFVPSEIKKIDFTLQEMQTFNYKELAFRIMRIFFDDIEENDLKQCIEKAYDEKFDTNMIAPLKITKAGNFLELFHGPTLAFKDMALSILPYLMITSKRYEKEEKEIVILTATSGDTGKAALEGFADVEGTKIAVFFPEEGVSDVQKRQMTTQKGNNTMVVGINGNFDDAQTGVKNLLSNKEYEKNIAEKGFVFSSANSINIGRLIPQVVYYFYAYKQMVEQGELANGELMNVVVPTGNFGNILAAFYAKEMGLPIKKLICASNQNKVLVDFFEQGKYDRNRKFHITNSPSMDILISSNLERLLFHISGNNEAQTKKLMDALQKNGEYTITDEMKSKLQDFYGGYADDKLTLEGIKKVYENANYLIDTHTSVAYVVYENYKKETNDNTPTVIVSTASPYKFTGSVMKSLDDKYDGVCDFVLLKEMEKILGEAMPEAIHNIDTRPIIHNKVCEITEMEKIISEFL
ncbi:MAG: threonine synthase [Cellulosilyticaceae bacterium]